MLRISKQFFLGVHLKRLIYIYQNFQIMIISGLNNARSKTDVVNVATPPYIPRYMFVCGLILLVFPLASELASVKEELELCGGARNISPRGSFTLAASKINQLENQIKFYKGREKDFQQEIKNLEDENENLRMRIKVLERQKRAINSPGMYLN